MEAWRRVFREGLAPLLSDEDLAVLTEALRSNDPRLLQGATTRPSPLQCASGWPVEAACLIAYPAVIRLGGFYGAWNSARVGQVTEAFAETCFEINRRLGEPAACRYLLQFFDDRPRTEVIVSLLLEVERELTKRGAYTCGT